jgi:aryl-phospho-beta-D-glucosidase BglC (GH1 family)
MERLRVHNRQIVDQSGQPVRLRGFNIGGWLNMEDFIDGTVGAEHRLRETMSRIIGEQPARFFFDRLLDYFFTEADVAFMKELGANVIRLPFNYRHFEQDEAPFVYLEEGFRRLDQAFEWCAKHEVYIILDFHAVPGWHNPDWHSDNANVHILLYDHQHFQDRFVNLWVELARRYKDQPALVGYDLMNEPVTRLEYERYDLSYYNWEALNRIHRRTVEAIRAVDPDHIVFLEGDNFSTQYDGLEVSFAPNIVLSTHNYISPTVSRGDYPGLFGDIFWNRDIIAAEFGMHSGTRRAFQEGLPIFVGEFGVWYSGHLEEIDQRVAALNDQIGVFESAGVHWTIWTFKDVCGMGAVNLNPDSGYLKLIDPILKAKQQVGDWDRDKPGSPVGLNMKALADSIDAAFDNLGLGMAIERKRFAQFSLFGYLAHFLQVPYAKLFQGKSEEELDTLLQVFKLGNCVPNQPVIDTLRNYFQ